MTNRSLICCGIHRTFVTSIPIHQLMLHRTWRTPTQSRQARFYFLTSNFRMGPQCKLWVVSRPDRHASLRIAAAQVRYVTTFLLTSDPK